MYTVSVRVKPYVKKFLEQRFGSPVYFPDSSTVIGSHFYILIKKMLVKPNPSEATTEVCKYMQNQKLVEIRVSISASLFYRYGWEICPFDQMVFNSFVESYIKDMLYFTVAVTSQHENKINEGIKHFRDATGLGEDDYSRDAARKFLYRLGVRKNTFPKIVP